MLSHSMPRHIVSIPGRSYLCHNDTCLNSTMPLRLNALLCRSYTCPCQCSATPRPCYSIPLLRHSLHYYSMPKPSAPLLCPCSAFPALPLLRSSSQCLDFAYPCHRCSSLFITDHRPCTTSPCFATSSQCRNMALLNQNCSLQCLCLCNASRLHAFAKLCLSTAIRFLAPAHLDLALPYLLTAVHDLSMSCPFSATALHRHSINQALPTQKHLCHCSATGPDRYTVRSRANP